MRHKDIGIFTIRCKCSLRKYRIKFSLLKIEYNLAQTDSVVPLKYLSYELWIILQQMLKYLNKYHKSNIFFKQNLFKNGS